MSDTKIIKSVLSDYCENELLFASNIYNEKLRNKVSETSFYKTLERMTKAGELVKLSKGVYHLPKYSKYGVVPVSTDDIVKHFTSEEQGTIIGYTLYNSLKLTTQISKTVNVISSSLDCQTKNIKNVSVEKVMLNYSKEVEKMIQLLDVLQNFYSIEDLNYVEFISFIKEIIFEYNDFVFEDVIAAITYKKSTIAFLQEILNHFNIDNNLHLHLSSLSTYNHPKMEEIYETAQLQE